MYSPEINELFYLGTSGLVLPVTKQDFPTGYKDKSRLTYYASLFNSIEINSTFKKLPMPRTIEKWSEEVGDHFKFTFKVPQSITHGKGLHFMKEDVYQFVELINHIGNKKGCILIQFPARLTSDDVAPFKQLLDVFQDADKGSEWRKAVEFRHASWYNERSFQLLEAFGAGLVFHDMPPDAPSWDRITGGFVYIRLHGPEKSYRGSYSEDVLKDYAQQIRAWNDRGLCVYVYFNNTLGDATNNLKALNRMMGRD